MNLDFILGELDVDGETERTRAALEDCREANLRAARLVSDMADAVQLASGEREPNFLEVDGAEMIAEVASRVAAEAVARDVQIVWTAQADIFHADADLLTRALERIVQRALWHTRCGGRVDVAVHSGSVTVRVERAPMGGAELPARSLGMHFAETAIRAQGGAMWTETDADGALLYKVQLPS
jgi:K+-sensing histidine kinase KdpD